ncbi:unnamed protein product [Cuscuta europaea]|uniref:Homeobox domain-containing protein n=1 Tax=Cuscuta europaea TaxID=41803 RepID=A0A9P1EC78_CUSEU|nr:unnamed protein product [Cuscuta europaea]
METRTTHRPDLHVLQYLGDYPCNFEQNMDLAQLPSCRYGNISYEPSSVILNFASTSQSVEAHRSEGLTQVNQELSGTSSRIHDNALYNNSTQNCGSWSVSNNNSLSPMLFGGSFPGFLMPNNVTSLTNNPSNEIPGRYTQKQFEDMQQFISSSSQYQNSSSDHEVNNEGSHGWHGEFERATHISNAQALSLSLSSVSPSNLNPPCVGPFGPFTGYATILRSSRFLKPAQQLLDEVCNFSGLMARMPELTGKVLEEVSLSSDVIFNAANRSLGGLGSSNDYYPRSEYQQTRVKLLHMQDEVCKKYSQYRQQMQMVVSSFESVAGLSAATPFILFALKTISGNFCSLSNAISNQLKNTGKALGEDLSSPTGKCKGSGLKLVDHGREKHGSSMGYLDSQPHIWRPQRGLPERAVSVLRAWLFDHFLHPYPTDSDKHMLATQTGLSRNQVSNWFINARVRVWKPMVEEIHSLETKAMAAEKGSNAAGKAAEVGTNSATESAIPSKNSPNSTQSSRTDPRITRGASGMGPVACIGEKPQSRMLNCHLPSGMDGQLMGFMPYQQNNIGSVSLTLGLRQGADVAQQKQLQQQQQQEPQQLQQHHHHHLGGGQMMIHDYFG